MPVAVPLLHHKLQKSSNTRLRTVASAAEGLNASSAVHGAAS